MMNENVRFMNSKIPNEYLRKWNKKGDTTRCHLSSKSDQI